jgi:hypothetical protein
MRNLSEISDTIFAHAQTSVVAADAKFVGISGVVNKIGEGSIGKPCLP